MTNIQQLRALGWRWASSSRNSSSNVFRHRAPELWRVEVWLPWSGRAWLCCRRVDNTGRIEVLASDRTHPDLGAYLDEITPKQEITPKEEPPR
jgi:hypothetical protein